MRRGCAPPGPTRPGSGRPRTCRSPVAGPAGGEDPLALTADDVARQLRLQAVVGKACMINNRSYRVGDVVDGYTLVQITEQGVVVASGANRVELKLAKK